MRYRVTIETRHWRDAAGDYVPRSFTVDAGNPHDARVAAVGQAFHQGLDARAIMATCEMPNEGPDLGQMFDMAYEDQCRDACGPGL